VRLVVADDAVLLREGLGRLLDEAGFDVVGLAADAEELFTHVAAHKPDVAIVDIRMPPTFTDEGLRAAREIKASWPATAILVLSQHVQASYAVELLSLGASGTGYLLKDRVADLGEFEANVRRVGEGGSVLDPSVVEELVEQRRTKNEPLERLSARERDVLAAMAEGLTNKGIAERLFIAEHTVEKHIGNIFAALQLPVSDSDHRRVLAVVTYLDAH